MKFYFILFIVQCSAETENYAVESPITSDFKLKNCDIPEPSQTDEHMTKLDDFSPIDYPEFNIKWQEEKKDL